MLLIPVGFLLAYQGWHLRKPVGELRTLGGFWVLAGWLLPITWAIASWVMWEDPDRLREGDSYWFLAIPIFAIGQAAVHLLLVAFDQKPSPVHG